MISYIFNTIKTKIINIVATFFAFYTVRCSYDFHLPYLNFVNGIPIRYYYKDDKLPIMLICNGCYEDIGWIDPVDLSNQHNTNVCQFDYSGYGMHSCKSSSEQLCYQDVLTVYEYLINGEGIKPENLIIYGRSLGTGVAAYLAHYLSQHNIRVMGLILISPFTSFLKSWVNISFSGDIFQIDQLAANITAKTLIIHGNNDWVISYDCGVKLAQLFPNLYNFVTIDGAGHGDIKTDQYYHSINKFIFE